MTTRATRSGETQRALECVHTIIERHIGGSPGRVVRERGGLRNLVYAAEHSDGPFIVRLSLDRLRLGAYLKEQFATSQARAAGVPTPEVLFVSEEAGRFPYMVERRAEGEAATHHPRRVRILRQMGRYCAMINSISTVGFWSHLGRSSATFGQFLEQELAVDARLESLARHRILSDAALYRLSAALSSAASRPRAPALNHGDLRLKNVVVDARGVITSIIDWEDCASTLAPEWDWSVALHDLSIDEKQEFLRGYGASQQRVAELSPTVKALNILNYVPEIERLAALEQSALLERVRVRLSGALDLYSL